MTNDRTMPMTDSERDALLNRTANSSASNAQRLHQIEEHLRNNIGPSIKAMRGTRRSDKLTPWIAPATGTIVSAVVLGVGAWVFSAIVEQQRSTERLNVVISATQDKLTDAIQRLTYQIGAESSLNRQAMETLTDRLEDLTERSDKNETEFRGRLRALEMKPDALP